MSSYTPGFVILVIFSFRMYPNIRLVTQKTNGGITKNCAPLFSFNPVPEKISSHKNTCKINLDPKKSLKTMGNYPVKFENYPRESWGNYPVIP